MRKHVRASSNQAFVCNIFFFFFYASEKLNSISLKEDKRITEALDGVLVDRI